MPLPAARWQESKSKAPAVAMAQAKAHVAHRFQEREKAPADALADWLQERVTLVGKSMVAAPLTQAQAAHPFQEREKAPADALADWVRERAALVGKCVEVECEAHEWRPRGWGGAREVAPAELPQLRDLDDECKSTGRGVEYTRLLDSPVRDEDLAECGILVDLVETDTKEDLAEVDTKTSESGAPRVPTGTPTVDRESAICDVKRYPPAHGGR